MPFLGGASEGGAAAAPSFETAQSVSARRKRVALIVLSSTFLIGLVLSATFRNEIISLAETIGVKGFGWIVFFFSSALTLLVLVLSFIPILLGFWWLFLALFIYIQIKRGGGGAAAASSTTGSSAQTFSQAAKDAWKKLPSLTGSGEGRIRL
ncbi:hypothetical protein IE81DRAFT_86673 [Ceraceosorus guamensis]|uniref:Uncharacterized protein n=1 Tax=Ceraceosorus guamensis TaxID=1522189 RepID=A0A316W8E7_9BASI|nr:hypothetical protein IE81DRAFT_86673 [Ceraceosorus guamensis]PWN46190.1 hypothetical protein IE81DRAFT_86673 [Ceraceosorus guamensis]